MMWLIICVFLLTVWWFYSNKKPKNLPPGPPNFVPVIGNALWMDKTKPERTMLAWKEQYGDIFCTKFGPRYVVVLSDPALIREAFGKPETASRPDGPPFNMIDIDKGLVFSTGEQWVAKRRFTLHHLRNFGMGKARLEDAIRQQADDFLTQIVAENVSQPIDIGNNLEVAISNIIWDIVASETHGIKDDRILKIINKANELNDYMPMFTLTAIIPWLPYVVPESIIGLKKATEVFYYPRRHLILPALAEHKKNFDPTAEPRDLLDCFLLEQRRDSQQFCDDTIVQSVHDLFSAGSETTSCTLRWAFCCLCARPDAQRRLQAEIDAMVGSERSPSLADRVRMPFTDAVLMETQRVGDVVPMGVDHMTTATIELRGYTIPAGTQLVSLLTAIHHSRQLFPEPLQFRPERFLDAAGKLQPSKHLLPFSTGKRSCLGEAMARSELFLFVTMAFQRFSFRFPDGFEHDLSSAEQGGLSRPKQFQIIATPR